MLTVVGSMLNWIKKNPRKMLTSCISRTIATCNPPVDPFLYTINREEQFDKTVSLNMRVIKLERSGKTA
jgi:hypothetical protein